MSFYKWFLKNKKLCHKRPWCRSCKFIFQIKGDEHCPFGKIEGELFETAHRMYKKEKSLKGNGNNNE